VGEAWWSEHDVLNACRTAGDTRRDGLLANEDATIKRKAGRLIWLNPMLGNPSTSRYERHGRGAARS